jgi:predicted alpha/beta-fold hydrolase
MKADVADVLPSIRTPTLVLNRIGNPIVPVEQSREAAAAINTPTVDRDLHGCWVACRW